MSAETSKQAVKIVFDSNPKLAIQYHNQIQSAWNLLTEKEDEERPIMIFKEPHPKIGRSRTELLSIGTPLDKLDKDFSIIIEGPAGIGKTQWALRFFDPIGKLTRLVSHIDDLKKPGLSKCKAVLFDDMDFKQYPRQTQIHICDAMETRSIHSRYINVELKKNLVRIFTCNQDYIISGSENEKFNWHTKGEEVNKYWPVDLTDPAILRRCTLIKLDHYDINNPMYDIKN